MAELTKEELRKLIIANKIKDIDLKQTRPKIIAAVRKQGYKVDVKKKTIQRPTQKRVVRKKKPVVKTQVVVKTKPVVKTPPRKRVKKVVAPVQQDPPKKDPPKKDPPKKDPPKKGGKGK
jgi:penicillin-insensitive murein endopeptidase